VSELCVHWAGRCFLSSTTDRVQFSLSKMVSPMLIVLPIIFLLKNIDTEAPDTLMAIRCLFFGAHSLVLIFAGILYMKIKKKADRTTVTIPPPPPPSGMAAWLAPEGATAPQEEETEMSTEEYDTSELKKLVNSMVMSVLISCFIHYKWEVVPPLVIQSVMNSVKMIQHNLFWVHIMGHDIERPFPAEQQASPFGAPAEEGDGDVDEDTSTEDDSAEKEKTPKKGGKKKKKPKAE